MPTEPERSSSTDTRQRILDVAIGVLAQHPDAGMGEIAAATGVVRRTVYGHFPTREDLLRNLTQQAVRELLAVLADVDAEAGPPETAWVDYVARIWPLAHRYRVLLVLRRGRYSAEIHALLAPVEHALADLVRRGQADGVFGDHLPPGILSQIAQAAVFSIADSDASGDPVGAYAASITSLLMLGVPEPRARALVGPRA